MKKIFMAIALLMSLFVMVGCTKIETGHVGIRTSFNGAVDQQELGVGFHQTIVGSVREYVANEMTLEISNLKPQTRDKSSLSDMDLTFTYSVDNGSISELVTKYKGRDLQTENGVYPAGAYVTAVVQSAVTDVVAQYDALSANENREQIRTAIKTRIDEILNEEQLKGKVKIHQIFIKNLDIDPTLKASATAVIAAQNVLKAKQYEVETAKKEAERMNALVQNSGDAYIRLLNAQAGMQVATAIREGKVNTVVVPSDFKGIVNVK